MKSPRCGKFRRAVVARQLGPAYSGFPRGHSFPTALTLERHGSSSSDVQVGRAQPSPPNHGPLQQTGNCSCQQKLRLLFCWNSSIVLLSFWRLATRCCYPGAVLSSWTFGVHEPNRIGRSRGSCCYWGNCCCCPEEARAASVAILLQVAVAFGCYCVAARLLDACWIIVPSVR